MAATAAPATGSFTNNGGTGSEGGSGTRGSRFTPAHLNEFRISAVIDRLYIHLCTDCKNDNEFENLCHSLARGVDFSISNHEVPNRSLELPSLVKKLCQTKNDMLLQAAIMVLMISVKSACQNGWFPDQDSEELINLAKKVASNFCSASYFNAEPHPFHIVISTVMSRFYPRLSMGHIFVSLEVKPGFDAYISDFQLSKNLNCSPGDTIRLFVIQTDSLETSSCLVTPPKVNFLLNGKGVEMRTSLFVDTGPLVPSVVTRLLKYGSNLLQAIGEFNGNYIIIVAFTSKVPNPDSSTLQNCDQLAPATVDADSEVIEGSSRISLNCPISFKRIRTPVKGASCKHIQCFDFDNYVDINSRRPSWRCPHCNQHVCFSDIRIDQNMVKILKKVGPNVSDIIVSSDGSWDAVLESEDTTNKPEDKTLNAGCDESPQFVDILDLTQIDSSTDVDDGSDIEDGVFFSKDNAKPAAINANNVNRSSSHVENGFWTGTHMSTSGMGPLNPRPNVPAAGSCVSTSLLTESSSSTNTEVGAFHQNVVASTSAPQTGTYSLNALQFPHYQVGNPPVSDYGRLSSFPNYITRTAGAAQALPAQTPASFLQRSLANRANPFITNGLLAASQASPAASYSRTDYVSAHLVPPMSSSSPLLQHSSVQQNQAFPCVQPPQQNAGFRDPNQVPTMYRMSNEHQRSSQPVNLRIPPAMIQSSLLSPTGLSHPQGHSGVAHDRSVRLTGIASSQQSHLTASATRNAPSYIQNPDGHNTPTPMGDQRGIFGASPSSQPVPRTDAPGSADMSWRPAARMRGALTGQAYDKAFSEYITQPSQQAQAARPVSNTTPSRNSDLPNLPAFVRTVMGTPRPSSASAGPVVRHAMP